MGNERGNMTARDAMIDQVETEDQALARIRTARARKALEVAPMLAYELRWEGVPLDGHTEGFTTLISSATDAADLLYVVLRSWAESWADTLMLPPPVGEMWRNWQTAHASEEYRDAEQMGFRANTTPERAHRLVSRPAAWLLWYENDIAAYRTAEAFQDEIANLVWRLRAAAGMLSPRRKLELVTIATEVCPECHTDAVRVEYFGEPMAYAEARGEQLRPVAVGQESEQQMMNRFASVVAGVRVRCAVCGWEPGLRPSKVARWLS